MNTRHLTTWLKSCTELNSQINKKSNWQSRVCSQKRDFFHPMTKIGFPLFQQVMKDTLYFFVCVCLVLNLSKSSLLKGRDGKARVAVYSLQCQSKYSGPEHEMRRNALQGLEKQLHLLLWSFSCAASLQDQIAFTCLLKQTWVEWYP